MDFNQTWWVPWTKAFQVCSYEPPGGGPFVTKNCEKKVESHGIASVYS